jgi:hypothetical protein
MTKNSIQRREQRDWVSPPIAVLFLMAMAFSYECNGVASIAVDVERLHIGHISSVDDVADPSCTLRIRNEGLDPLVISSVKTSCGCLRPDRLSAKVPSGSSTEIRFSLSENELVRGVTNESTIFIGSNDPARPNIEIPVDVFYEVPVWITPNEVMVEATYMDVSSRKGEVFSAKVLIDDSRKKDLEITDVELSSDYLETHRMEKRISYANGSERHFFVITVIGKAGYPIGPINELLSFRTNSGEASKVRIPIKGAVTGPCSVRPNVVVLDREIVRAASDYVRTVVLHGSEEQIVVEEESVQLSSEIRNVKITGNGTTSVLIRIEGKAKGYEKGNRIVYDQFIQFRVVRPVRYMQTVRVWGAT